MGELPRVLKRSFLVLDVFYMEKLLQTASITTQICFENLKLLNDISSRFTESGSNSTQPE